VDGCNPGDGIVWNAKLLLLEYDQSVIFINRVEMKIAGMRFYLKKMIDMILP
jgi:hypothetical protein